MRRLGNKVAYLLIVYIFITCFFSKIRKTQENINRIQLEIQDTNMLYEIIQRVQQ